MIKATAGIPCGRWGRGIRKWGCFPEEVMLELRSLLKSWLKSSLMSSEEIESPKEGKDPEFSQLPSHCWVSHIYTRIFDLCVMGTPILILFDIILLGIMLARIITQSPSLKE